ncbi:MAG: nucleotidyltransferase family protein [Polyangiaceae bacterium]|nr:nucleotidyltransferase family protein [Polyangiaceae bacterium]
MPNPSPSAVEDIRKLAYNTLLEEELLSILRALAEEKIDALVLKGLPLLDRLGTRIETRRIADNDILVHASDAPRAASILAKLGYHAPRLRSLEMDLKSDFQHPLFRTPPRGAPFVVELHWNAFPLYLGVPESILWENRQTWRLRDTEISVLNKELCLLHLASHYLQHLGLELRILEEFARAHEAWREELNLPRLIQLINSTRTHDIFPYCLQLAKDRGLLKSEPVVPLTERARSMLRWLPGPPEQEAHHGDAYRRSLLVWWFVARNSLLKLIFISTFPSIRKMEHRYQETRRSRLFLLYLCRPLRPLWRLASRLAKKRAAWRSARLTPGPLR